MTTVIDFTKPATSDNYSTGFVPNLQANQTSLAALLDPTYVTTVTGAVAGAKRFNTSTTVLEQYNGTTWSALSTGYALKAGDTFTGVMTFANNVALDWKDNGGTARRTVVVDASNNVLLGDVDNLMAATTFLRANSAVKVDINGATAVFIGATGVGIGAATTAAGLHVGLSGVSEGVRIANDNGYYSGFNTANTTRTGFLKLSTSAVTLAADLSIPITLSTGGTERARIDPTTGALWVGTTSTTATQKLSIVGGVNLISGAGSNSVGSGLAYWNTKDGGTTFNGWGWQLNASFGADLWVGNTSSAWVKALTVDTGANTLPGANNAMTLGSTSLRWSTIYGVAGNYSGTVTAAAFSGPLTGNVTGNADTATTATNYSGTNAARAWVLFNGTGTISITSQLNCSSLTDNAVGDYTVNFTSALSDALYSVTGCAQLLGGNFNTAVMYHDTVAPTTSGVRVRVGTNGGAGDVARIGLHIFR